MLTLKRFDLAQVFEEWTWESWKRCREEIQLCFEQRRHWECCVWRTIKSHFAFFQNIQWFNSLLEVISYMKSLTFHVKFHSIEWTRENVLWWDNFHSFVDSWNLISFMVSPLFSLSSTYTLFGAESYILKLLC